MIEAPRYSRPDRLTAVEVDGEVIVYDPREQALHRLNRSAAAVWVRCDGTRTLEQIVADTRRAFPGSGEDIAGEIVDLAARLEAAGLIVRRGSDRP